jgi:hypothetical protein
LVQAVAVFKLSRQEGSALAPFAGSPAASAWKAERHGADQARNVARLKVKAKVPVVLAHATQSAEAPAKTGTDDWESF